MSRLQTLARFTTWNYGSQLVTVVLQLGYAAVTSRLVDDSGFGAYAVALAVFALVNLLATGGLGQTVGRMKTIIPSHVSALAVYALGLGGLGFLVLFLTAHVWATLWAVPDATNPIRVLAVSAMAAPVTGLLTGLLRRQQRFRVLAITVIAANATAMSVGVLLVIVFPGPASLVVSPALSVVLLGVASLLLNRKLLFTPPAFRSISEDLHFSWKVTGLSAISYLNGNVGRLALSRGAGTEVLGQWNRADVLTTVPLEQAHRAAQQAIYPEFRHDIGGHARTRKVWTDMLILGSWASFPLAATVGVIAPVMTPFLFGPGWELASQLAFPISLILGVQMLSTTLSAALEAVGQFRWILATHLTTLVIQCAGAFIALKLGEWKPVLAALAISHLVQHTVQVSLCSTRGLLEPRRLAAGYGGAAIAATIVASTLWGLISALEGDMNALVGWASASSLLLGCTISWLCRRSFPPMKIIREYRKK